MKRSLWFVIFTLVTMAVVMPKKKERRIRNLHKVQKTVRHKATVVQEVSVKRAASAEPYITLLSPTELEKEESVALAGLPRGQRYLTQVKAVPSVKYHLNLGPALLVKEGLTFFRDKTGGTSSGGNVVYDQRRNTFLPMSATIKVPNVTPEASAAYNGRLEKHHYNEDLQILYLQSTNEELIDDYKALYDEGLKAELEVVPGVYRTK